MHAAKAGSHPSTLAVASGKGGVGKTTVTAGLAISLARQLASANGKRRQVAAVDLDLGCGNLNTCLGVRRPQGSIEDFLLHRTDCLTPLWSKTPLDNLQLICGSYQALEAVRLSGNACKRLFSQFDKLEAKAVLIDLGAGSSEETLESFLRADRRLVVISPDALSLHNGYLFIKRTMFHYLANQLRREDFLLPILRKLREILDQNAGFRLEEVVEQIHAWDRYSGYIVAGLLGDFRMDWLVNMFRGGSEKRFIDRFQKLLQRQLGLNGNFRYLGSIEFDRRFSRSVQNISSFFLDHPESRAALSVGKISAKLFRQP